MSAILGRIAFDGRPVSASAFGRAAEVLAPYGPDGGGRLVRGNTGFAQAQLNLARLDLARLDLARNRPSGNQPLVEGPLTLVADAVLDDRAGLADALGLPGDAAREMSDGALILRAWRRWGEDALPRLVGDFAFAIWDDDRRHLFLARDHVGTRPLYWTRRGAEVLFATDLRALVSFDEFDWRLDEAMVARYLDAASRPLPKTLLAGVGHVGPGHHLTLTTGAEIETRWWDPRGRPLRRIDPDEAARQLNALIAQAVACRIDTDAPVGSHLSGGIDSTAVTVLAARALRDRGTGLTAAYCWAPALSAADPDMGEWDERRIVGAFARSEGITLRYGDASAAQFLDYLRRPLELEGTADLAEELPVIEKARADGIRVLLSGWGGDEAVTAHGSGYISYLLSEGRPVAALRAARALGGSRRPSSILPLLWSEGIVPFLPDRLFDLFTPYAQMAPHRGFMSRDLAARFPPPGRDIRPLRAPRDFAAGLLLRGHLAARMETWAAWAAPAGLQYRYPLLDRRLLDFVLTLPPEIQHGPGRGRHLMRKALKGTLPRRLGKSDPANQRLRARVRGECWQGLAARPPSEKAASAWLDLAALANHLLQPPADDGGAAIAFSEICSAMRVAHLAVRWRPAPEELR